MYDIVEIMKVIPHRPPFLLIDQILEVEPGISVKARKIITGNEEFFKGHYPDYPVMPGMLIVEALAQAGAFAILCLPEMQGKRPFFGGVDKVKFRQQVRPGDTLILEVTLDSLKKSHGKGTGKAYVGGKLVCQAEFMFILD